MTNLAEIARSRGLNFALSQVTDHKLLVSLAADFAARTVHLASHPSAQIAIDTARAFLAGTATAQECQTAADAARDASTAWAVEAAAHAAHAAAYPEWAAHCAAEAATKAIWAAKAAAMPSASSEHQWQMEHFIEKVETWNPKPT